MKSKLLIVFTLVLTIGLFSSLKGEEAELLLRDNLSKARTGDYLVTGQNKNFSVMIIRNLENEQLTIEEITMPMSRVSGDSFSWRNWVEKGAPGHTCWVMYSIHLPSGTMNQAFSYTKNEWVTIPQSQNFLSTLLNLRLQKVPNRERKKIGPPPATEHVDCRQYWQPKLVVDGKTIPGVAFDAWRTRWPKDGTELSGKTIEVFVPVENDKYPSYFPYWLQVSGVVGNAKVRIVDSGTHLFATPDSK
ncbi:MAG TPA: hypothetical protein VGP47_11320 [Parachlamydiaceae bacterium]|nr:hypothetical protein [Parachlamydiaceae bacterium]